MGYAGPRLFQIPEKLFWIFGKGDSETVALPDRVRKLFPFYGERESLKESAGALF